MKEHPILFSAPMVRALLAGTKTQTRRAIKRPLSSPGWTSYAYFGPSKNNPAQRSMAIECGPDYPDGKEDQVLCPYGAAGDRLWVRETWQGPMITYEDVENSEDLSVFDTPAHCVYRADGGPTPEYQDADENLRTGWCPSIHMPRWASRITLELTAVRVERLQEISDADAEAEGIDSVFPPDIRERSATNTRVGCYRLLWESINGAGSWDLSPWVWVLSFTRIKT